jgi:hypothetical protein
MSIGQADERAGAAGTGVGGAAPDGRQRDEAFVVLLRAGDATAFGLLFDAWADPLYDRISNRGFTTADASRIEAEAFAAAHRRIAQPAGDDAFRVLVMRAGRQAMLAADAQRVDLRMPVGPYAEDRLTRSAEVRSLAADAAVAGLLWESAEVLGDQVREVLDLHFRHRLSAPEVAGVMQETTASVEAILGKVEAGYGAVVRAKIMWRQGNPTHEALGQAVAGHPRFDTTVVKRVAEHLRTCQSCRDASQVPVPPIEVFAAIPIAIAPPGFKEDVVKTLEADGVSMAGSASSRTTSRASVAELAAGAAAATGGALLAPPPQPDDPSTVVPPLGDHDQVLAAAAPVATRPKARTGRNDKPAEMGLAVGLAAFAGPMSAEAAAQDAAYATPVGGGAEPDVGAGGPEGGGSKRGWVLAAVATVAVLAVLTGVILSGSGSKQAAKVATSSSRLTTTTTVDTSTSPSVAPTTTAAGTVTTAPVPGSSTSTTAKATTTTVKGAQAPATTVKAVTTTTVAPFPTVTLNYLINTITIAGSWDTTVPNAPQAIWSVTANQPVTVSLSGPGFNSSAASGHQILCPGTLGGGSGNICTAPPGTYTYTLNVVDQLGRTVRTETRVLTVT